MAVNRVHEEGRYITLPVPIGTESGDPVAVGKIPGVAVIDREEDGTATVQRDGVYDLEVTGVKEKAEELAIAVGDILFINAKGEVNVDPTGTRFGYAGGAVVKNKTETIPVIIGY